MWKEASTTQVGGVVTDDAMRLGPGLTKSVEASMTHESMVDSLALTGTPKAVAWTR